MSNVTIVVLVSVLVGTVVAVVVTILALVRRLRVIAADVADLQDRLTPALEELQRDADVTGRELERVSAALDALARSRREGR